MIAKRWTDGRRGDNERFPNHEIPGFVPLEFDGLFHGFGTDLKENHHGFHKETVAIIEDPSGKIHMIHPKFIQFTDK